MFTLQEKKEAFKKLPDLIKDFIISNENIEIIESIASKFQLNETAADKLDSEVHDTMMELQTTTTMAINLKSELGVPEQTVNLIVTELNNQIFLKLENLKNTPTGQLPDHLVSTPTGLMSGDTATQNLPEILTPEEKIMPLVGTPGEKLAWEQRKQKLSEIEAPKSNYDTVDPYREPIQ